MAAKKLPNFTPPASWERYKRLPGLVLGFHGCDKSTAEKLLRGRIDHLKASKNKYDWLGDGVYFWEADPWRALDFATQAASATGSKFTKGRIKTPYVVGAVIDLGYCCNLLDQKALDEVAEAHSVLKASFDAVNMSPPENKGPKPDFAARYLDQAVIEMVHEVRHNQKLVAYDTVRAAFIEGEDLYEGAGFQRKNHIQIAVRNLDCIKGYFRLPGF